MADNVLFKSAFMRKETDSFEERCYNKQKIIRSDYILENIFSYLLRDHYNFDAISPMNEKEKQVFEGTKEILDVFRESYATPLKNLIAEINVEEITIGSQLLCVADEMFCDGITWNRIIAFIVFVGELTIIKKLPTSLVDVIYECFSRLVKEKLESWIEDHDGWDSLNKLSVVSQQENSFKASNTNWTSTLKYNIIHIIRIIRNYFLNFIN